uniref:Uncharacterized protein n=1 Tax=Leersia perrieri TaxID=77586 RepID=A0A0D9WZQ2_9ORYZ
MSNDESDISDDLSYKELGVLVDCETKFQAKNDLSGQRKEKDLPDPAVFIHGQECGHRITKICNTGVPPAITID